MIKCDQNTNKRQLAIIFLQSDSEEGVALFDCVQFWQAANGPSLDMGPEPQFHIPAPH